jgi:hypothetical protein
MATNLILLAIFILNLFFWVHYLYRKTKTLEYSVKRFVKRNKLQVKLFSKLTTATIKVSEDQLVQLFLRDSNEHFREHLRDSINLNIFIQHINKYLKIDEGKYVLNGTSKYLTKKAPYVPIPKEYLKNAIEL